MTIVINGTTGIAGVDGSAGTPAVQGTDTNTGVFYPAADTVGVSTGGSERMRVDSSGNVGIGTTNIPSNKDTVTPKLIVNGAGLAGSMQVVRNTTVGAGGAILELTATRGSDVNSYTILQSGDGVGSVVFGGADGNEFVVAASINAQVDGTPGDNDMPGRLIFNTTADGASSNTERMRIDSSGNLLVGTTSNSLSTKVFVSGSIGAQQTYGPMFVSNENNTDNVGRGSFNFQRGGTLVGQIVTTNSTCAYNSVSDYRLKENIAPMIGALGKVAQLKPCTFTWKSNSFIGQGFIAHELQEVVPDCVVGEKDAVDVEGKPVYQGVDTSFLVATLTAAIQEQQALITALTARIEALENK